jgi:uncharacterized membrane protein YeiH
MDSQILNFWLGNLATIAFAITAVLAVNEKDDIDIFAVVVLGGITAVGGGTLRDLIIGAPVFWLPDATEIRLVSSELYIIPVLLGCVSMIAVLKFFPEYALIGEVLCSAQIFLFRACAIHWNLSVPNFLVLRSKK